MSSTEDLFDFGFTAVSEDELETVQASIANQASSAERLEKMYKSILPLLDNLEKNPEKDYIYWPDRTKKIEEFRKRLNDIHNGK
jgi:hypothetical protein